MPIERKIIKPLKRKPIPNRISRVRFAEALDYAIRARGLDPKTISPYLKRQIADVVRNTMDTTGALRK